jgi:hypothetical protein
VVLPAQYVLVASRLFNAFTVFIPVYVFLAIPVVSAFGNDPQRFLERTSKIQWVIMVCIYGMSHAPALLLLDLPKYAGRGAFMVFYLVVVVATAQIAQGDLTTAFNDAAGRTLAPIDVANADLGGRTLAPGLYKSTGTLALTGTVVLDAQGDVNGVWIFQIASSLGTATGSAVVLVGGAKASNIFWQVGTSATLATTTAFKGTIMADQSITLAHGATLEGRALARIATVTMDANAIIIPAP